MNDKNLKGKYVVAIDQDKCIGCGMCESIAEMVFKVDDKTGKAEVISQDGEDGDKMMAAQACPTNAIEIRDLGTGEVQWPKVKLQRGGGGG